MTSQTTTSTTASPASASPGTTGVPVTVDGVDMVLPVGMPLVEALRDQGIHIPSLCNDVRLDKAMGNCGMCVVELRDPDDGASRRVKACQTPVAAGMDLSTGSNEVDAYRTLRLEQLLSDHNADCEAPCHLACPAGIDIQLYLKHVANGNMEAAVRVIKDSNPFPSACGRVCPHPCEAACRRKLVDDAVSINAVKRFASDWDMARDQPWSPAVSPATGKTVAVVGAGPSGLSAAYYLAQRGHAVTVYEKQPKPGGMMRYGIPEYRLPKATLDAEIGLIAQLGVDIRCGQALGVHQHLEDLRDDHDAVYLAFGSWQPTPLSLPGDTLPGVWLGIAFLEQVTHGTPVDVGNDVVVVGGGNTAIDCVRTAKRLGASNVTLVYRRTVDEMPAEDVEIADAIEEGIDMVFLTAPDHITAAADGSGRKTLHCLKMELGEPDRTGRRRPIPIEGSDFEIEADTIIGAIGQSTNTQWLYNDLEVALSRWGDIRVDEATSLTNQPGIFAGGDCVTGPATVVAAVGAGRRAAQSIDELLSTGTVTPRTEPFSASRGSLEDLPRDEFEAKPRVERASMPRIDMRQATRDFTEIDLGLVQEAARREAARCLACGCSARYDCELRNEATAHGVRFIEPLHERPRFSIDETHPFLIRDQNKCIACGKCVAACSQIEGVDVLGYRYDTDLTGKGCLVVGSANGLPLTQTACISCGQCATACPCGALDFRRESDLVWQAINNPDLTVVGFLAPAPRSVIGRHYGWTPSETAPYTAGLMRRLGFDVCFDVAFAADLTIIEEANEFIGRVQTHLDGGAAVLPQFTSCCPGWVSFVEKKYPALIPNLSTCRSPQGMMAATIKNHYATLLGKKPENLFVVSIMPCLAKKDEARREQLTTDGQQDVDAVLTTQEFIEMVDQMRINLDEITPQDWDAPYAKTSGAGVIFGASGGVAEAAVRMAVEKLTGVTLDDSSLDVHQVRGLDGVREAVITVNETTSLRIAVTAGLSTARPIIEAAARGEDTGYDLIEIMACPGG
ncbi:MAG: FAD-dependent oxidoreductase, partial [Cellulomonadaceae bacterium]|nr:FAD-dependent oxidoreductase [Cellulomonadaceae bacterium]